MEVDHLANGSSSSKLSLVPPDEQQELAVPHGLDSILDDDDDDFELTFSLDVQQRAVAESLARSRQVLRSEEYRQLFHLPPEEVLVQDFNCALQKKILLQGHMYLFEHYVCFYSNIFGYEKKKIIVLKDVTSVRKARTAGLFPNAIEITAWGKKSFFASFLSRDEAYRLIVQGWSRHSKYAILDSDSQSTASVPTSHQLQAAQEQQDVCLSESSFESRDIAELPAEINAEAEPGGENPVDHNTEAVQTVLEPQTDSSSSSEAVDPKVMEDASVKGRNFWEVENEGAPKVPQQYRTVLECELPVDVKDFFDFFFSDDAKKFCESFHKRCGDEGFHCTQWAKDQHFGHVRDVSFRHPVKVYFGPKASNCQEVQRYRVYQNSHLIVETSQQMNDIPYGDYFRVEGRWDIVPVTGKASQCAVKVYVDVAFSKKTVWRGKIEQGTYDECKDVYATWLSEAFRTLQEKGIVTDEVTKVGSSSQPRNPSDLPKGKAKRKLEADSGRTQGHVKVARSASSALVSQTSKSSTGQRKEPHEHSPSYLQKFSQHLPKQFSLVDLTSINQTKMMVILMCVMAILLLVQTGIVISLTRSSRVQYIPFNQPRWGECREPSHHGCGWPDVAWLESSAQLMWEEIAIAEARLRNMQESLELLKINLKLAEKRTQKTVPSTTG